MNTERCLLHPQGTRHPAQALWCPWPSRKSTALLPSCNPCTWKRACGQMTMRADCKGQTPPQRLVSSKGPEHARSCHGHFSSGAGSPSSNRPLIPPNSRSWIAAAQIWPPAFFRRAVAKTRVLCWRLPWSGHSHICPSWFSLFWHQSRAAVSACLSSQLDAWPLRPPHLGATNLGENHLQALSQKKTGQHVEENIETLSVQGCWFAQKIGINTIINLVATHCCLNMPCEAGVSVKDTSLDMGSQQRKHHCSLEHPGDLHL